MNSVESSGALDLRERLQRLSTEQRHHLATLLGRADETSRENRDSDQSILVAYLVSASGNKPNIPELRAYLKSRLPEFMLPSRFVWLESLPVGPNGKIDRQQLPKDALAESAEIRTSTESDAVQDKLSRIWREVLGTEVVDSHDNFFEIGGHSLLAIQVLSRIREGFGIELPMRVLFEQATIAALSKVIRERIRI